MLNLIYFKFLHWEIATKQYFYAVFVTFILVFFLLACGQDNFRNLIRVMIMGASPDNYCIQRTQLMDNPVKYFKT